RRSRIRCDMTTTTLQELSNAKIRDGTARPLDVPIKNRYVRKWVDEMIALCQPDKVYICNGSHQEQDALFERGVREGTFIKLNQEKLPGCYLHRSNPNDVARSEHLTFICTPSQDTAGPTNNWMESKAAYTKLRGLFNACMKGRTMYVVPFVMGPI